MSEYPGRIDVFDTYLLPGSLFAKLWQTKQSAQTRRTATVMQAVAGQSKEVVELHR